MFGSANRDERAFPDPDVFDIERTSDTRSPSVAAFTSVLGAALARMEARIALDALLDRVPDWEVDLESARRLRSGPIRGYTSLPITDHTGLARAPSSTTRVCFTATARFIAVDVEHSTAHVDLGAFGDMLKRFAGSNGD